MFGWRRRNDGFEWREYVRTTILARRARRRQKIEDARDVAVEGLKEAGRMGAAAGASGLRVARAGLSEAAERGATGAAAALRWLGQATAALLHALAQVPGWIARHVGPHLVPAARLLRRRTAPLIEVLDQRDVRMVIGVVTAVAGIAFITRVFGPGFDGETVAALITTLLCLVLLVLPRLVSDEPIELPWAGMTLRLSDLAGARIGIGVVFGLVGAALLAGGGWLAWKSAPRLAALVSTPFGGARAIEGRATALSGDTLSLGDTVIRLAGIEAPELDQQCSQNGSRRWRCGHAAKDVLARLLRGGSVTCEITGRDATGRAIGTCRRGGADVAADLVRRGYAFADAGLFSRYSAHEREARGKRAGIWRGDALRPAEYRARRWEDAKRAAPDGCPIKGQVSSDGRVYVLPWSPSYDRIKVRSTRGDRWFCTEEEAQAAGFERS